MSNINEVAKLAKVGIATVSRVINNSGPVKDETRQRVEAAIKELNFIPSETARSFKKQTTKNIGLLIPTIAHPFFSLLTFHIEQELSKLGYKLMICNSADNVAIEDQYMEMLKNNQVAGIIITTHNDHGKFTDVDLPLVSIDRFISNKIPYISSDNLSGGYEAAKCLDEAGCKKVAYLGNTFNIDTDILKRKYGFEVYCQENKIDYVLYEHDTDGYEVIAEKFLKAHPDIDGVFAYADMLSLAVIKVANEMGIKIPENLKLIGYDNITVSELVIPTLTSVEQDVHRMGMLASQTLVKMIEGKEVKKEHIVPIKIVERKSTERC